MGDNVTVHQWLNPPQPLCKQEVGSWTSALIPELCKTPEHYFTDKLFTWDNKGSKAERFHWSPSQKFAPSSHSSHISAGFSSVDALWKKNQTKVVLLSLSSYLIFLSAVPSEIRAGVRMGNPLSQFSCKIQDIVPEHLARVALNSPKEGVENSAHFWCHGHRMLLHKSFDSTL